MVCVHYWNPATSSVSKTLFLIAKTGDKTEKTCYD